MYFNLNQLLHYTQKKIKGENDDKVIFKLGTDNQIRISTGEVAYFMDYRKMDEVLELNNVNYKSEDNIYEVLSRHIINQLFASRGSKVYPEIITHPSDLIQ